MSAPEREPFKQYLNRVATTIGHPCRQWATGMLKQYPGFADDPAPTPTTTEHLCTIGKKGGN